MDAIPNSIVSPGPEVKVNQQPGRQIMRELPPRRSGPQDIQNGVNDLSTFILERTTS
jgi:hypothetical protein